MQHVQSRETKMWGLGDLVLHGMIERVWCSLPGEQLIKREYDIQMKQFCLPVHQMVEPELKG